MERVRKIINMLERGAYDSPFTVGGRTDRRSFTFEIAHARLKRKGAAISFLVNRRNIRDNSIRDVIKSDPKLEDVNFTQLGAKPVRLLIRVPGVNFSNEIRELAEEHRRIKKSAVKNQLRKALRLHELEKQIYEQISNSG